MMFFIYLSAGLLLVLILHSILSFLRTARPHIIRHIFGLLFIGAIIALIIAFLRFGLPHMAAIISFAAVLMPLVQRFRKTDKASASPTSATMSVALACEILGVEASADENTIREAHHRLIHKNHPDMGGSSYLASQINEARDVLLAAREENKCD
jgi:hypothetical protein